MAKTTYQCNACGYILSKWAGQCPKCKEWNTIDESAPTKISKKGMTQFSEISKVEKLKNIKTMANNRIKTGINEFDRVAGGGMVSDSIIVLAAPPGTGKSTLCLHLCDAMIKNGYTALYASGEESASQIKQRAERLNLTSSDELFISETTCLDSVLVSITECDADFIIIDSIQTFYLNEFLPSRAGNPTQVLECASALQECAKRSDRPRMIILIGQMNKEDELVGSRSLEHLVDAVFIMDGDSNDVFRMLFATKNRFGDTGETGFFQMTEKGLFEVKNPSEFFLTEREQSVIGTALTVLKEGSRPIVIEIESLVTPTSTSYPTRITDAMSRDRLNVLIAILEQHCRLIFHDKNVFINTQNNIKLRTSETSLATLMTIVSSYFKKPLPLNSVFLADVGLTGELKKIQNIDMRLKELDRMGYDNVYVSHDTKVYDKYKNINVIQCRNINDVLNMTGMRG